MKVKLVLKEPKSLVRRHKSAAHYKIVKEKSELKHQQIDYAVSYWTHGFSRKGVL